MTESASPNAVSAITRAEAARVVARVMSGRSLDDALAQADESALTPQNRSLLRALAYGVLREHRLLSALVAKLLEKPLQQQPELHALLLLGIHQLRSMRMPAHAAVTETVNAVMNLNAPWARGLVNAVLRRYQREAATLEQQLPKNPGTRLSYPDWLVQAAQKDWPQNWDALLAAGNEAGPLTLRVNRRRLTVEEYLPRLAAAGIAAQPVPEAPDAVVLDEAVPVEKIPGFAEGEVSVQDAAAQLAVDLLELVPGTGPGLRVLDACAAPGGKTAHILERADCEVVSVDQDAERLKRIEENLARLQLTSTLIAGDARKPSVWWDQKPFDRILLDAPCSATGVIRRHPDIKWLRRAEDIPRFAQTQFELLSALLPLLAPGGVLVYAVCSVLEAEGAGVVRRLLDEQRTVRAPPLEVVWGEASGPGRRLPSGGNFDGFFYARLVKVRTN